MDTVKITVTKEHIKDGQRLSPTGCPIALAVKATGVDFWSVGVNDFTITIRGNARAFKLYKMPKEAVKFRHDFDTGKRVKPLRFVAKLINVEYV